jgi:MscS family membrane protein
MKRKLLLVLLLSVLALPGLLPAAGVAVGFAQAETAPTEPPTLEAQTAAPAPTRIIDRFLSTDTPDPAETPGAAPLEATGIPGSDTPSAEGTPADQRPTGDALAPSPTALLEEVIMTRTPEPTVTPGVIQQELAKLVARAGLARTTFLGLTVTDWIALGGSLLVVLAGYLIGTWLIRRVLPRLARRTATQFDDRFLEAVGGDVRWLVVLLILHFVTVRLTFVNADLKALLKDAYFVVGLVLFARITFKLIDRGDEWARERALAQGRGSQLDPPIVLLSRMGRVLVAVLGLSILLSYFGVNVTALATVLGLGGLAFSLAAQDTIADAISGFIILVDQPFRIGDRIEIEEVETWGDVVEIGLRTTRIRTRDNRMVIVPNSVIGKNQVINYTYPDPKYRIQTHVGIAYGTDIEAARRIIVDTVRQVEGVLPDRPVDALYVEMGDSAMVFRVRWWIESYGDTRRMFDKVHTVLQRALDDAGIECPFPTQTLNLQFDPKSAGRAAAGPVESNQARRKDRSDSGRGASQRYREV